MFDTVTADRPRCLINQATRALQAEMLPKDGDKTNKTQLLRALPIVWGRWNRIVACDGWNKSSNVLTFTSAKLYKTWR